MNRELINLGEHEDKDQQKAIEFALLQQRVDLLEKWKSGYEEAQNQRWENFDKKIDKFTENFTKQFAELTAQLNEQKNNWFNRVPWWITLLFGSMASIIVYLFTGYKH